METLINSHLPQSDDIEFRSLEYLFVPPDQVSPVEPPWVDVIVEDAEAKHWQVLSLNARVQVLQEALHDANAKLADANMCVGYLRGVLEEKDEQLKLLPDLRMRAAKNIAADVERNNILLELSRLESENESLSRHLFIRFEKYIKSFWLDTSRNQLLSALEIVALASVLAALLAVFAGLQV